MGNRSRFVALGSAAAAAAMAARRRRLRLRRAAEGIQEAILPSHVLDLRDEPSPSVEGHAAGHQHLGPLPEAARPAGASKEPATARHSRIADERS